jgi:hypothetical protein
MRLVGAPAPGDALWKYHPIPFSLRGFPRQQRRRVDVVYDVNNDGLHDVVTSLSAPRVRPGVCEQRRAANGEISFVQHMIMDNFTTKNRRRHIHEDRTAPPSRR